MHQPNFLSGLLAALLLILAGCNLPSAEVISASSLAITEPDNGARFKVGEIVSVRSQIISARGVAGVDLLVNGQVARSDALDPALQKVSILQPWIPSQPGIYQLQTRAGNAGQSEIITIRVDQAPPTTVTTTRIPSPTFTQTHTPTVTPSPTHTPTPTRTLSPTLGPPMATGSVDANCRFGPGQVYQVTSYLRKDQSTPITGRSADWTWWVIQRVDSQGTCWISASVVITSGDTYNVPVVNPPPTPTIPSLPAITIPAPEPSGPKGSLSCRSTVFLQWDAVSYPGGISRYEWRLSSPSGKKTGSTTSLKTEVVVTCATTYTWQVRAMDGSGNPGPYSGVVSFKVK